MASSSSSSSSLLILIIIGIAALSAESATFKCTGTNPRATCRALVDYVAPNATTLSGVASLFGVKKLFDLLAVNGIDVTTAAAARATPMAAKQRIRIPFPCSCANGTGASAGVPVYVVKAGDGLDHIATDVFARIVTFQEIAAANGIPDPDNIAVGQRLKIPIPCSCDSVDATEVVHYGHVVQSGSSVGAIAATYGTTEATLLRLNGMSNVSDLQAGQLLDVPLRACSSSVRNDSLDSPLLVPNATYALTAHQCVKCSCDSANNWTLKCEPSKLNSTQWPSCPSTQCDQSSGASLLIGNTTTTSTCSGTTCAYAGYNNRTIYTALIEQSTCPASNNDSNGASKMGLQGWNRNLLFVSFHLLLLTLALS